ncbi:MAG: winged helix-turn-helix domain-containing protein, partial [Anaerolineaceae bacterium]|nr:winged helix-turn-helix domain-containing protein [Anaerolineaceae bacterium]
MHFDGSDLSEILRTRKERALLAYLAEEPPRVQTREKVAEFFWPNRPETYARMNLRQALLG